MLLNDIRIKSLKPSDKSKTYPDGLGLRLLVHANGSKYWQFRYTFEAKEKIMALGTYPAVSLLDARKRAFNARELLQSLPPIDPQAKKEQEKDLKLDIKANTFKVWSGKWFDHWKHGVSKPHSEYTMRRLDMPRIRTE